ncbi:MAG: hypothetical protein COA62_07690 [Rhodobiaceae bacterium]|nr:MAG: hypothetical protein COA62_07690 [Rhodobiaceae bacterium]
MTAGRRILVLRLRPFGSGEDENGAAELVRAWIERERAAGAEITILASSATLRSFQGLDVTIWPDGAPNGVLRLLALVRRIAWGEFSAVYDFDGSRRTRAYRLFVRPCPPWHSAGDLKAL